MVLLRIQLPLTRSKNWRKKVLFVSSLSDRLRSLGVKVGVSELAPPEKVEKYPIERVLPVSYIETDRGQTYIVEQDYPVDYQHGKQSLLQEPPLIALEKWAREPGLHDLNTGSFAFLDTETSGLAGGTGTYAFWWGRTLRETTSWRSSSCDPSEKALLLALEKFLAPCQALVSYNGKAFDAPLNTLRPGG
jgi:uncharacterized protein YprB with RNaseH-like and TPR domain